ncbi:MAG: hypothetical protein JWQ96_3059 [Segetibacter sp.]|nr:hypothetical protein [Segetibacter sp.]
MKRRLLIAFTSATLFSGVTNAQVALPAASPAQTIRQDFGMGRVELTYSRPAIKGRKLFGNFTELAPLGELWRTGANASTKIKFTDNVIMGGKSLDTGTYVLYTIPNKGNWEIVLNKGVNNWGTDGYKQTEDVVRFIVPADKMKNFAETFTMQFADVKNESMALQLMWGKTLVNVPITTNIKDRLRTQLEAALKTNNKPYQQAAAYYYEWEKDYTKALDNVNKGINANPKAFWLYLMKARIQKDMGDKTGAKTSANKTIEVATEAKNNDYVRMAKELLEKI